MTRIVLAVLWIAAGIASLVPAAATPFLFDAPGSESSGLTVVLAIAVLVLPVLFILGGVLWLISRKRIFLLPAAVDVAVVCAVLVAIQAFCGGRLAC